MARPKKNLSWPELLIFHTGYINRCALIYVDEESAKDITQDVLLKALQSQDKFDGANLKGWLSTITRNVFINHYRKDIIGRNQINISDSLYNNGLLSRSVANTAPGDMQKHKLLALIQKLPVNLRTMILLRAEGYSYEELAKIMDVPLGTIRSSLLRARVKLQEMNFPV